MTPHQPAAVTLILQEHSEVKAVLKSLDRMVRSAITGRRRPKFAALRNLLSQVGETTARPPYAHRSRELNEMVRDRCPPLDPVIDRLEANRRRCDAAKRELELLLAEWESSRALTVDGFQPLLASYVQDYLGRLEVQASYVLPVAQEYLSAADWEALEMVFTQDCGHLQPLEN